MMRVRLRNPKVAVTLPAALLYVSLARAQGFGGTVLDHLVRGDSLLAQGRGSEAIAQFQEARTLCPTDPEIVAALQGEARGRLLQNEWLPAVGLLEEAATRFPEDPRTSNLLYQAGFAAQRAGEIDRSIDLYRKALEKNPTPDILPPLKFQLAQAMRMRARPGDAIEVLKTFEKDYPESNLLPNVLYTLAIATHDKGTGDGDAALLRESAAIYGRLIERFPGRPAANEAHFEMGLVLSELGRKSEAADYFSKYVTLNPGSPVAATALERVADRELLRSPKQSAQSYALALVKAKSNPKPTDPAFGLSRWLPLKQTVADLLSRVWMVALLGVVILAAVLLTGRLVLRRFRRTSHPVGA
ncbi:MAG TPA: tetratricopeptide repeat protein [Candidatus Polarisedimenticolia bacterium]|jgi:tetratricopeptide (TPR) repeat protein|nr:tetratricopeptide repeat protein [Candidatus Polarisedimenticolia bacterium]